MNVQRWGMNMNAMRLTGRGLPLVFQQVRKPEATSTQVVLQVLACGVCRTDLHLRDGERELPDIHYPITPGHEIVGRVEQIGPDVSTLSIGDRVGVPWVAHTCGQCEYCVLGLENLCTHAAFTGYTVDGGYAQYALADEAFCLPIPAAYSDVTAAPLLCAGLIGYRAYRAAGEGTNVGLYGFGAAAHLLAQVASMQGRNVYAFTRPGDIATQRFARTLGAVWAGGSDEAPPLPLDAAIIFAAVGALVPVALAAVRPGGRVVCAGIEMSDIPRFPYRLLWGERSIASVANLTRTDGLEFMKIAADLNLRPEVEVFDLAEANVALERLRSGSLSGAAVLTNRSEIEE